MATSDVTPSDQALPATSHALLLAQFNLYRAVVAKKHNFAIWLPVDPKALTGPDLEQWVAFLKDAAHLPPG